MYNSSNIDLFKEIYIKCYLYSSSLLTEKSNANSYIYIYKMVDIQKYIKQKHKIKGLIHLCQLNNFPTAEFIFVDDQLNYPIDKIFVLNE